MVQNFLTIEDNSTKLTLENGDTGGLYMNDTITKDIIFKHNTIEGIINSVILKHDLRELAVNEAILKQSCK